MVVGLWERRISTLRACASDIRHRRCVAARMVTSHHSILAHRRRHNWPDLLASGACVFKTSQVCIRVPGVRPGFRQGKTTFWQGQGRT